MLVCKSDSCSESISTLVSASFSLRDSPSFAEAAALFSDSTCRIANFLAILI